MFSTKPTILNTLSKLFLLLNTVSLPNAVSASNAVSVYTTTIPTVTEIPTTITVTAAGTPASANTAPASSVNSTVSAPPPSIHAPTSSSTTGSSVSAATPAASSAKTIIAPISGTVNVTSKCDHDVLYLIQYESGKHTWQLLPTEGMVHSFNQYPSSNDTDAVDISYAFMRTNSTNTGVTILSMFWVPAAEEVQYNLYEESGNGISTFMPDGYLAWPMPATSPGYPYCNKLQCGANENPCAASFYQGKHLAERGRGSCTDCEKNRSKLNRRSCQDKHMSRLDQPKLSALLGMKLLE